MGIIIWHQRPQPILKGVTAMISTNAHRDNDDGHLSGMNRCALLVHRTIDAHRSRKPAAGGIGRLPVLARSRQIRGLLPYGIGWEYTMISSRQYVAQRACGPSNVQSADVGTEPVSTDIADAPVSESSGARATRGCCRPARTPDSRVLGKLYFSTVNYWGSYGGRLSYTSHRSWFWVDDTDTLRMTRAMMLPQAFHDVIDGGDFCLKSVMDCSAGQDPFRADGEKIGMPWLMVQQAESLFTLWILLPSISFLGPSRPWVGFHCG